MPLGALAQLPLATQAKQQVAACWVVPTGANDIAPQLRLHINRHGAVTSVDLLNGELISNPSFWSAARAAILAVFDPRCSRIELPPEEYDQWRTLTITFDARELGGPSD